MSKPPGDKSGEPKANPSQGDDRTKNSGRPGDESLADDLLIGADVIAEFIYGDRSQRRKIYYLRKASRIPIFTFRSQLCARKSTLKAWIEEQEKRGSFRAGAEPVVSRSPSPRRDERDDVHGRGQNPEGIGPGQPS